jgi:hypothetical protein
MKPDIPARVASILKGATTPSLPLSRLHGALVAEVGPGVGTYAQLRTELARRADLFLILEPRDPLGELRDWSGDARSEYEAALLDAGGVAGHRIALAAEPPLPPAPFRMGPSDPGYGHASGDDPAMLHSIDASLVHLWGVTSGDAAIRADLAEAMSQADLLRRVLSAAVTR